MVLVNRSMPSKCAECWGMRCSKCIPMGSRNIIDYQANGTKPEWCPIGKEAGWIPILERVPETDDYILVSFENYNLPDIGRYEADDQGDGAFYPGDEDKTYISYGLFVNAWMPLPESYREDGE